MSTTMLPKLSCWLLIVGVFSVAGQVLARDNPDSTKPLITPPAMLSSHAPASTPDEYYVLESRHRVFADFAQVDTVRMNQRFLIGEGEEEGEVFLFNPHFVITDSGKVMQVSDTLYNPAVRVRVSVGDSVIQESWAFYFGSAPHFRRNDMLGFRLLDFKVSDRFVRVEEPKPVSAPSATDSTKKSD